MARPGAELPPHRPAASHLGITSPAIWAKLSHGLPPRCLHRCDLILLRTRPVAMDLPYDWRLTNRLRHGRRTVGVSLVTNLL
jgi:hypothetical protein